MTRVLICKNPGTSETSTSLPSFDLQPVSSRTVGGCGWSSQANMCVDMHVGGWCCQVHVHQQLPVHLHVRIHACMYVCMQVCRHVSMYLRMYVCMRACMLFIYSLSVYLSTYVSV